MPSHLESKFSGMKLIQLGRGRGRGWDDLGEWHCNMYTIMEESNRQPMSDAGYSMLGAGAWG